MFGRISDWEPDENRVFDYCPTCGDPCADTIRDVSSGLPDKHRDDVRYCFPPTHNSNDDIAFRHEDDDREWQDRTVEIMVTHDTAVNERIAIQHRDDIHIPRAGEYITIYFGPAREKPLRVDHVEQRITQGVKHDPRGNTVNIYLDCPDCKSGRCEHAEDASDDEEAEDEGGDGGEGAEDEDVIGDRGETMVDPAHQLPLSIETVTINLGGD